MVRVLTSPSNTSVFRPNGRPSTPWVIDSPAATAPTKWAQPHSRRLSLLLGCPQPCTRGTAGLGSTGSRWPLPSASRPLSTWPDSWYRSPWARLPSSDHPLAAPAGTGQVFDTQNSATFNPNAKTPQPSRRFVASPTAPGTWTTGAYERRVRRSRASRPRPSPASDGRRRWHGVPHLAQVKTTGRAVASLAAPIGQLPSFAPGKDFAWVGKYPGRPSACLKIMRKRGLPTATKARRGGLRSPSAVRPAPLVVAVPRA